MSKPIPPSNPKPPAPGGEGAAPRRQSGRVQFDERGQAVWEWAVQTGMFDRNADTSRVRALSESAMNLSLDDTPAPKSAVQAAKDAIAPPRRGDAVTPYDRAPAPGKPAPTAKPAAAAPRARDTSGGDPYSRGPAKNPESMTFNPYDRSPKSR